MQGMIGLSSTSGRRGRQMYLRTGGRNMQRGELIVGSEEYRKEENGEVSVGLGGCVFDYSDINYKMYFYQ